MSRALLDRGPPMSNASQVELIFFAALDKNSAEERSAYLAQACGDDEALLLRVQRLLDVHVEQGEFLAQPAVDRAQFDFWETEGDLDGLDSAAGSVNVRADSHLDPERGDHPTDNEFSFLQPSSQPGSLGRLAHYEVLEVIGRGGFGNVVKAFDVKLQRDVAIKIISPHLARSPSARSHFLCEARSAAAVRHKNVITIFGVEDQPVPYLVMEYITGQTLQQRLDQTGRMKLDEVLLIGRQVAAGLAAAHAKGLIHRDIKPDNILLEEPADRVKITDFGLARAVDDLGQHAAGGIHRRHAHVHVARTGPRSEGRPTYRPVQPGQRALLDVQWSAPLSRFQHPVGFETGQQGAPSSDPGDRSRGAGLAVRPDRRPARQAAGPPYHLSAGGGRRAHSQHRELAEFQQGRLLLRDRPEFNAALAVTTTTTRRRTTNYRRRFPRPIPDTTTGRSPRFYSSLFSAALASRSRRATRTLVGL